MNICLETPLLSQPIALALGTFDGLHQGHRQVIHAMQNLAKAHHLQQWVYSFQNHPAEVLRPEIAPPILSTWQEKVTLLQNSYQLDGIVLQAFDEAFSHLSPENFVSDILVKKLQVKALAVGFNFRFGYQARGNVDLLTQMGTELGFEVQVVPAFQVNQQTISSTLIRELIQNGKIEEALPLLNQTWLIQGEVIHGQGIAAKFLGIPTANIQLSHPKKVLPILGVYACLARPAGSKAFLPAIMNLGNRPTFDGLTLSLEVHILDFVADLYGQILEVYPQHFLRPEQKFNGPEALKQQIQQDVLDARQFFAQS